LQRPRRAGQRKSGHDASGEWAAQRARYITLESIAPLSDDLLLTLLATAA
jgi:hypothetical protein